jgi:hypothetical protein
MRRRAFGVHQSIFLYNLVGIESVTQVHHCVVLREKCAHLCSFWAVLYHTIYKGLVVRLLVVRGRVLKRRQTSFIPSGGARVPWKGHLPASLTNDVVY